jgi:hypothetical protein
LRIRRYPAHLFGAPEGTLAVFVPAVVELALILVGPFLRHLMRAVRRAGSPIHEERLVGRKSFMFTQPTDRIVGKVFAQMIVIVAA